MLDPKESDNSSYSCNKLSDTKEAAGKAVDGKQEVMTDELLDDMIERLLNYEKYPEYSISENKGSGNANLPYILKENEIRLLI